MLELSKIKCPDIHSKNKVRIVNPPTKTQRKIYDLLQIELPDYMPDKNKTNLGLAPVFLLIQRSARCLPFVISALTRPILPKNAR